jgi:hypothetical protein
MSIFTANLLIELSDNEQEFLIGGADFDMTNSNFGQNVGSKRSVTTSGPQGNSSNTNIFDNKLTNSAQAYLGLGGMIPTGITNLASPVLDTETANLLPGMITAPGSINTIMSQAPIANVLP